MSVPTGLQENAECCEPQSGQAVLSRWGQGRLLGVLQLEQNSGHYRSRGFVRHGPCLTDPAVSSWEGDLEWGKPAPGDPQAWAPASVQP